MNIKSQQLTFKGNLIEEYDKRLSKKEINEVLISIFGDNLTFQKFENKKIPIICGSVALLCSQITYLGNPHPIFKKRIQIKPWFRECYEYFKQKNINTLFIGIYRWEDNIIFCDFDTSLYIRKKMHNSSAHVYINDLYQAMCNGVFTKTDRNHNVIKIFKPDIFKKYVASKPTGKTFEYETIIKLIDKFNRSFQFNQIIWAIDAIREMYENKFKKWKEAEWAGWYIEYKFDQFIRKNNLSSDIKYINNSAKRDQNLDFDIEFPKHVFYGDLKSSSIEKTETILNDAENIMYELNKYGKLWYLIYEHETIKDKNLEHHPMTKSRINFIRQIDKNYKIGNDLSYLSRMKAAVTYKKMFIIEINRINVSSLLDKMSSNFHQPDKVSKRKPKFKLTKSNIENAIIYRFPE